MGSEDRITTFREAASGLIDDERALGDPSLAKRLEALGQAEFHELCDTFRKAEVLEGMLGYLRNLLVGVVCAGVFIWASPRVSEAWVILLMLTGAVLILVSLCLDVLSYLELERRCVEGLHMRVSDVLFEGGSPIVAAHEFTRSIGKGEPVA